MSAGPGAAAGHAPARSVTLARLERELMHARDVHEDRYAAQIEAEIARLSQGSAGDPRQETTGTGRRPAATKRRAT